MAALSIRGVGKAFGATPVLTDVTLEVASGALVAILGASGSGKTTLLRLVGGFERADAGRIALGGQVVCDGALHVPAERRRIGYVAQEGALFPHLSVAGNILFGLRRRDRRLATAEAWLERVGLPAGYAARPPHLLSGGEQQRVALARALAPAPRLVLLDEPFSALDAALRVETRAAVAATLQDAGATALLVTHDQSEALSMGQRVAVLREGRLVQVAAPQDLYRMPVDAALASFVGEAILLDGMAEGGRVRCPLGDLPIAAGPAAGPVEVLVRPEQLRLLAPGTGLQARIMAETYYGHDASIGLEIEGMDGSHHAVSARVTGQVPFTRGDAVGVVVEGAVVTYARGGLRIGARPACATTGPR